MNVTTMETLFKEAFGLGINEMKINEPYLVEEANIGIKSLDDSNQVIFSKILRAVKKSKRAMYIIELENGNSIRVAKDHLLAINSIDNLAWVTAEELYKLRKEKNFFLIGESSLEKILSIKKDGEDYPLDIEVEGSHNYFSNGVLSHNSMYGPDYKAAFSGQAVDFYSSWTARLTRTEDIKDGDETIGIMIKVRNEKSKLSNPKRVSAIKLLFNGGIDSEDEYLDYLKKLGIIEQRGAWFYNEEWGMKVAGKNGVADFLHNNPELYEKVKKQVNDMICGKTNFDDDEDEDSDEEAWNEYTEELNEAEN